MPPKDNPAFPPPHNNHNRYTFLFPPSQPTVVTNPATHACNCLFHDKSDQDSVEQAMPVDAAPTKATKEEAAVHLWAGLSQLPPVAPGSCRETDTGYGLCFTEFRSNAQPLGDHIHA